jgi:ribosomal RNA-processing protein 8
VDAAVFCLSLMGVNYIDFIIEAHKKLKNGGLLMICEVTSRILDKNAFVK